ncbi:MAG: DNA repair exonuclease [Bacillota bacterium]|nr:DNA repair exonuclease [Bacillota bacterium]
MRQTTLRIALAADWHLGFSFAGIARRDPDLAGRLREMQAASVEALFQRAEAAGARLLLIAGDLFDSAHPAPEDLLRVIDAAAARPGLTVVLAPGNHDPFYPDGYAADPRWPDWVHRLPPEGERLVFPELGVTVDGAGFAEMIEEENRFTGFREPIPPQQLAICLLHADLDPPGGRSLYRPLSSREPWLGAYDLVALGHQHRPRAARIERGRRGELRYPGPPFATTFVDMDAKGFWLADARRPGGEGWRLEWRAVELEGPRFVRRTLNLGAVREDRELAAQLAQAAALPEGGAGPWLLDFVLEGARLPELVFDEALVAQRLRRLGWDWVQVTDRSRPAPSLGAGTFARLLVDAAARLGATEPPERVAGALGRIAALLAEAETG